jgi:hypothetical protein
MINNKANLFIFWALGGLLALHYPAQKPTGFLPCFATVFSAEKNYPDSYRDLRIPRSSGGQRKNFYFL